VRVIFPTPAARLETAAAGAGAAAGAAAGVDSSASASSSLTSFASSSSSVAASAAFAVLAPAGAGPANKEMMMMMMMMRNGAGAKTSRRLSYGTRKLVPKDRKTSNQYPTSLTSCAALGLLAEELSCFATVERVEVLDRVVGLEDGVRRFVPNSLDGCRTDLVALVRLIRGFSSSKELKEVCFLLFRPAHASKREE